MEKNTEVVTTSQWLPPNPTRKGMENTSTLKEGLYRWCPTEDDMIKILVQLAEIPYGPQKEIILQC